MCRRSSFPFFFFNDTATTEIYTLSLHDALPICGTGWKRPASRRWGRARPARCLRSEEHTSELQSPYVISYAVFCLLKKEIVFDVANPSSPLVEAMHATHQPHT